MFLSNSSGVAQGFPRSPQGRPGGPEVDFYWFLSHFGLHLGPFLVPFWMYFRLQNQTVFMCFCFMPFCIKIGALLAPFWGNFRSKKLEKTLVIFGYGFDVNFGTPGAPSEAKTIENAWRVVQNRRSTFSRPSASGVDFGSQNGAKMGAKSVQN